MNVRFVRWRLDTHRNCGRYEGFVHSVNGEYGDFALANITCLL